MGSQVDPGRGKKKKKRYLHGTVTCILYLLSVLVRVISVTVSPIIKVTQVVLLCGKIAHVLA